MLQVISTTTDNCANFVKAFREFGNDNQDGTDTTTDEVDMIDISNELNANDDIVLSHHVRCCAHTLNLPATRDVEDVPGWSSGPRACFTKVRETTSSL